MNMKQFGVAAMIAALMCLCFPITGWAQDEQEEPTFTFALQNDGTAKLTKVKKGLWGKVEIPSTVDGQDSYGNNRTFKVTEIEYQAFVGFDALDTIVVPEGVVTIGSQAFEGCTALRSVQLPSTLQELGNSTFSRCAKLPSIVVPEGVKTIAESVFSDCDSLTSVQLPSTLKEIRGCAFHYCKSLSSVVIPEGVETIRESAFRGCSSLSSVVMPEGLVTIEHDAFSGCSSLPSIVIPESVEIIGSFAFSGCSSLSSVVMPESVETIEAETFKDCSKLTSVQLPDSLKTIGRSAFANCVKLETILLPDGLKSIATGVFRNCKRLRKVTIPESVTVVDGYAFDSDCEKLTDIYCCPLTPPDNDRTGGAICGNATTIVHVPFGSKAAYEASEYYKGLTIVEGLIESRPQYKYKLTAGTHGHGTVTLSADTVEHGGSVTLEFVPERYYEIDRVFENSREITDEVVDNRYVKKNITANIVWEVEFRPVNTSDNTLYFGKTVIGASGFPAYIPVSLLNADAITAFQFDLSLPSGVTLRKIQEGDGERYDMSLSDRADTSHVVSVSMLSDTVARVVVYSTGNVPFNGNDGAVLSVGVDVSAAVALGEYALRMENIELVTPEEQEYLIPSADGLLVVKSMQGDVNGDGRVTISDVILTVNYLLGDTTTEIDLSAADLNGDGRVSLGDVIGIINLILSSEGSSNATARSMSESTATTDDLFSVSLDRGDNRLLFSLDDNTDYTAFQLDVTLPEGVSVSGAQVGPRALGHTVDWRVLSDGKVRVVVYSPANALLKKVEGALFALQLSASDKLSESFPVSVTDILLATPRGMEYKSRSLSEILSIDDAVEELHAVEPFTISVSEGVLQVHATESARLPLYTIGGTLLRVLDVKVGLNTYEGLPQGVYLLNKHKIFLP